MSDTKLNGRLRSAASFVRQRAVLADVGTDHAYLPIFLLSEGRVERVIATDVNAGPLASAEDNLRDAELLDRATLVLCDGAADLADSGATDYAICGMGGELIAEIIGRAPHLKDPSLRLILQPMSKQPELRRYLSSEGFSIRSEAYSYDAGKYYVCMMAEYTGECRTLTDLQSLLPDPESEVFNRDAENGYLRAKLESYNKAARGKIAGGDPMPEELEYVSLIGNYLSKSHLMPISVFEKSKNDKPIQ